jgi:hypothetical protein
MMMIEIITLKAVEIFQGLFFTFTLANNHRLLLYFRLILEMQKKLKYINS